MNDIISKWNEDVKRGKRKERIVNIQRHIIEDKNTKIINLKLLREIDKKHMATELSYIMTDVTGKSVNPFNVVEHITVHLEKFYQT